MYKTSLALLALTVGLFSASQAKASTLDTFVLTGDGNTFSFSLTSPSNASNFGLACPGHSGVCFPGVSVTADGHSQTDTIEFTANDGLEIFNSFGLGIVSLGLDFFVPWTLNQQSDYYSDTVHNGVASVSFYGGTYYFTGNDNGYGNYSGGFDINGFQPYKLVIDPPAPVPEPSSLALMSSGLLAAAGAVRRRMKK